MSLSHSQRRGFTVFFAIIAGFVAALAACVSETSALAAKLCNPELCCEEACDSGCNAINPNFYGLCEASGCVCHELLLPPGPPPQPGSPSGPEGCRACTINQYCLITGLGNGICVNAPIHKCGDFDYYYQHFCECEPDEVICQIGSN